MHELGLGRAQSLRVHGRSVALADAQIARSGAVEGLAEAGFELFVVTRRVDSHTGHRPQASQILSAVMRRPKCRVNHSRAIAQKEYRKTRETDVNLDLLEHSHRHESR